MKQLKWTNDKFAEAKMAELGIPWERKVIPVAAIDRTSSLANHARLHLSINDEVVEDYSQAMLRGDVFPAIVLEHAPKGYFVLSGNHRLSAAVMAEVDEVDAYVVGGGNSLVHDLFPRVLNRGHGLGQDRDEATNHALWAVAHFGKSVQEASALFNVSQERMHQEMRVRKTRNVLQANGVTANALTRNAILKLSPIKSEAVLASAAKVIIKGRLAQSDVNAFIDRVKENVHSEPAQLGVIEEYGKRVYGQFPGAQVKERKHRPIRTRFLTTLTRLEGITKDKADMNQLGIVGPEEREDTAKRLKVLAAYANQIARTV